MKPKQATTKEINLKYKPMNSVNLEYDQIPGKTSFFIKIEFVLTYRCRHASCTLNSMQFDVTKSTGYIAIELFFSII